MKLDKWLTERKQKLIQIDDIYDELEYYKDLSKVIKLTLLREDPQFLLDFLNLDDLYITKQLICKLDLKINDFKILDNIEKLNDIQKNEVKQLKKQLKQLRTTIQSIDKKINKKNE